MYPHTIKPLNIEGRNSVPPHYILDMVKRSHSVRFHGNSTQSTLAQLVYQAVNWQEIAPPNLDFNIEGRYSVGVH